MDLGVLDPPAGRKVRFGHRIRFLCGYSSSTRRRTGYLRLMFGRCHDLRLGHTKNQRRFPLKSRKCTNMRPYQSSANINFREPPSRLGTPQGVYYKVIGACWAPQLGMVARSASTDPQKPAKSRNSPDCKDQLQLAIQSIWVQAAISGSQIRLSTAPRMSPCVGDACLAVS